MCPMCVAAAALLAGKATSAGGLATLVIKNFKRRKTMASSTMEVARPRIVSRAEWLAARKQHLAKEKEFTQLRDELSRQRRELPWEKVEKPYAFDTPNGTQTLAGLFEKRSQLIVYHFMLGPGWKEGCPGCSLVADHFDGLAVHLANRDVTLTAVSRAPLAEIEAFKKRMGWRFKWASSFGSDFNHDFQVSFTPEELSKGKVPYNYGERPFPKEEAPGASVFAKDDAGQVFHTYSTYARGLDILMGVYNFLDLAPKGRDEDALAQPMTWVRHHDRYSDSYFEHSVVGCCSSGSHS